MLNRLQQYLFLGVSTFWPIPDVSTTLRNKKIFHQMPFIRNSVLSVCALLLLHMVTVVQVRVGIEDNSKTTVDSPYLEVEGTL